MRTDRRTRTPVATRAAAADLRITSVAEPLEGRVLFAATGFRSVDGSGNNLSHAGWGATGSMLTRLAAAAYADGRSSPAGAGRASARAISNAVSAQAAGEEILSATHLSSFAYLWGQFIDHDMDLTSTSAANGTLNVAVPTGDPSFDPLGTGTQVIPMSRSNFVTDSAGVRQQVNDITAYLDGSQVYGSDAARAAALRTFAGGKLKTSADNLLPFNTGGLANANDAHIFAADKLFLAGDVRANENSELTALQTLFVREHNRLAANIASRNLAWTDEQVYQQARKIVVGEIENITYNEYLPALLGRGAVAAYGGYKPNVNAGISNEFSTAAFRLGHSMLADDVEFINDDGTEAADPLMLAQVFFDPTVVQTHGIDSALKYLASSNSEEIDPKVVTSLRNFLFGAPGSGGLDLASLNIQRGRDHGLASYNATRATVGLPRVTTFAQISSDPAVVANLKGAYASVDDVDLWVGGLAEDHAAGSNVGPTFQRILVDQFTRTRDGDRFYFENYLTGQDLSAVRGSTLANVIRANTGVTNLQPNVFVFNATVSGSAFADGNRNGRRDPGEPAVAGVVTVKLVDASGATVSTTTTDRNGLYRFDGLQLGTYTVVPVLSGGQALTTATASVNVTKGTAFENVSFGVAATAPTQPPPTRPAPPPPPRPAPPPAISSRLVSALSDKRTASLDGVLA